MRLCVAVFNAGAMKRSKQDAKVSTDARPGSPSPFPPSRVGATECLCLLAPLLCAVEVHSSDQSSTRLR